MSSVTVALSLAMVGLGIAMIVVTLTHGGGAIASGVVIGLLFVLAGGGRLWTQRRR